MKYIFFLITLIVISGCSIKNGHRNEVQEKTEINYIAKGDQKIEFYKGDYFIRDNGNVYKLTGINRKITASYQIIIWAKGTGYPEFYQFCNKDEYICSGYIILDKSFTNPDEELILNGKVAVLKRDNNAIKPLQTCKKPLFSFAYDILTGKTEFHIRD